VSEHESAFHQSPSRVDLVIRALHDFAFLYDMARRGSVKPPAGHLAMADRRYRHFWSLAGMKAILERQPFRLPSQPECVQIAVHRLRRKRVELEFRCQPLFGATSG
jgi:hypothetical protein